MIIANAAPHLENPLTPFLVNGGKLILDGGLATEFEQRGFDLSDSLWSARLLRDAPEAIMQVQTDYLAAGADCIATASYQATIPGFVEWGLSVAEAEALIVHSAESAVQARDTFWGKEENKIGRIKPLVAASIGPYGAYLANGAEYTGDYDLDETGLYQFHRRRWQLLAESSADLIACETIPALREARALVRLSAETPGKACWISFSCRNEWQISDGTPLATCAALLDAAPSVVAIGINCTLPRYMTALIGEIKRVSDKPIVVYPNSGELWDAERRCWVEDQDQATLVSAFATQAVSWCEAGATLIGGCCRTTPDHIQALRAAIRTQ
jgi:homocysteine S-methyltransferase